MEYMELRNVTRYGLAERTGVSLEGIDWMLEGKYKPQPPTLEAFSRIFKCKVKDLWPVNSYGV